MRRIGLLILLMIAAPEDLFSQTKSQPGHIETQILILHEQVVEEQWAATKSLVNAPADASRIEPGQCVRFGVVATGDDRDALLKRMQFAFEFRFLGKTETFSAEPAQAIKQIKPEGGDFVTQTLGVAGVNNPTLSLASLAASRARWCAPLDAADGTATVQGKATAPDGKAVSFKPRRIDVRTFETARKQPRFKDSHELGEWMMEYYAAPDPAELLPALRLVASDETARKAANSMVFFVSAFKASKPAAEEMMKKLPAEGPWVRRYAAAALKFGGYSVEPVVQALPQEDQAFLSSLRQPDPFDMSGGLDLGARQDMLWDMFFATGSIQPVRTIASELAWNDDYRKFKKTIDEGRKPDLDDSTFRAAAYSAAGWSLGALSVQAPLVSDYIEAIRAAPDTPSTVKEELGHLFDNPAFRRESK
jgi:hypothetical protein